jgi:hypothetical protein
MFNAILVIHASALVPLTRAWRSNRGTSLEHVFYWALAAWIAWALVLMNMGIGPEGGHLAARYVALCLSIGTGIAVLGARRPGVGAWNFIVASLLLVLLLPLLEGWGEPRLSPPRVLFLMVLAAGVGTNYLPTRLGWVALVFSFGLLLESLLLLRLALPFGWARQKLELAVFLCVAATPWLAWFLWHWRTRPRAVLDGIWLNFRDRYGLIWALRIREQINHAAKHADWPVRLGWFGFRTLPGTAWPDAKRQGDLADTLLAALQRFERPSVNH